MKITWQWLNEYIDLSDLTPQQVAKDLTNAGIPVEWMEQVSPEVQGVLVGYVTAIAKHPEADRLRVCTVDVGYDEQLQIVCGAQNVDAGQKVPVAVHGSMLPGGKIKKAKLRGVESNGMICSAGELGLDVKMLPKEQTQGIFVLPSDASIGESIGAYLGLDDTVMELELTPNRSDCLSLYGVANEVAAIYGKKVKMPVVDSMQLQPNDQTQQKLFVELATPKCAYYCGQVVSGLALAPSPLWMQMRLLAVGMRPINNLVDITNYVMLEWGQPLHAFDYAVIEDQTIIVRQALEDEAIITLDDQPRVVQPETIMITDRHKNLGLAGVMGGQNSEVTTNTTSVVIESAIFDPIATRKTAKALNLRSEASSRFEKGIDPAVTEVALSRAASLMIAYAHGQIASEVVRVVAKEGLMTPTSITVHVSHVARLLGFTIEQAEMLTLCARLGFAVKVMDDEKIEVSVPTRRPDITREADMIEEFARLVGYDKIPTTTMKGALTAGGLTKKQKIERNLRDYLIDLGLHEVWTYSLTKPDVMAPLGYAEDHPLRQFGTLLNPLSEDRIALRTHMLPSLLEVAMYNRNRNQESIRLFEFGTVFLPKSLPMVEQPGEQYRLTGILSGTIAPTHPHHKERMVDFYDVAGLVQAVFVKLGFEPKEWIVTKSEEPFYHPHQCAKMTIEGNEIAHFGRINKQVVEKYDLADTYYFELDLERIIQIVKDRLRVKELPKHPSADRDLAFVVERDLPVSSLLALTSKEAGEHLESVTVFDVYTGEKVAHEQKSVALHFVFRAVDHTLSEREIQDAIDRIMSAVTTTFGATLRE